MFGEQKANNLFLLTVCITSSSCKSKYSSITYETTFFYECSEVDHNHIASYLALTDYT